MGNADAGEGAIDRRRLGQPRNPAQDRQSRCNAAAYRRLPESIVIVQEAKVLPPSLSADTEGPIAWEYDNDTGTVINIAAVNVQWSAKAIDDDGSTLPWLSVYQAEDYINAVPQRNTDSAPRSGFIVITADREEVAELRIPVSQGGAPDHLST